MRVVSCDAPGLSPFQADPPIRLHSSDDDLNSLSDLFNSPITTDVISYVSSTDPRMLSGLAVAAIFRYSVSGVRNTVSRLTGRECNTTCAGPRALD